MGNNETTILHLPAGKYLLGQDWWTELDPRNPHIRENWLTQGNLWLNKYTLHGLRYLPPHK